uniref:Uncharacterized protein n=1 Tax=Anguilla anguilla TaxID=7936 RepID=A0A0E9T1S0_ANGAN
MGCTLSILTVSLAGCAAALAELLPISVQINPDGVISMSSNNRFLLGTAISYCNQSYTFFSVAGMTQV